MAIVNRTLDASEQRSMIVSEFNAIGTGLTLIVGVVPFPATLDAVRVACFGVSGSPTFQYHIQRFIVGAGLTNFGGAATVLSGVAVGTSGIQSVVLAASGSTLLNLAAGDVLMVTTGGANSAVTSLAVHSVVKAAQEIKTWFGV